MARIPNPHVIPALTANEIVGDRVNQREVITEHNGGICSRDFVYHMRRLPHEFRAPSANAMVRAGSLA